jgi:hypothetical protein
MTESSRSRSHDDEPSAAPGDWRAVRPMDLEPYYCHWVNKLTADDLHAKSDIATVLALLHRELDDVKADYLRVHKEKTDLLFARSESGALPPGVASMIANQQEPDADLRRAAAIAADRSGDKHDEPRAYLFNGHAFTPNLLTSDQRARAVPLYAITPSHGGERSMPAMTDTLLSEMIEAWFAEHPVEPYIKREDEPEFFKRVERVYRAVERRMTPSATEERSLDDMSVQELQGLLARVNMLLQHKVCGDPSSGVTFEYPDNIGVPRGVIKGST